MIKNQLPKVLKSKTPKVYKKAECQGMSDEGPLCLDGEFSRGLLGEPPFVSF